VSLECVSDTIMARKYEPIPRFHHTSAQMADKVVVYSGMTQDYSYLSQNRLVSTVEMFDPQNEQWEAKKCTGVVPVRGVCRTASVVVRDHLYLCGGIDFDGKLVNFLHRLNPKTYDWCELIPRKGESPMTKTGAAMVACGDDLALLGGLGIPQDTIQRGSSFISGGIYDGSGWTNEFHIYQLSEGVFLHVQQRLYIVCSTLVHSLMNQTLYSLAKLHGQVFRFRLKCLHL